jgi:hypothetical protein
MTKAPSDQFRGRNRPRALTLGMLAVGLLTSCTGWPSMGRVTFVTTHPDVVAVEVLRENVRGRYCVTRTLIDTLIPARVNKIFVDYSLAVEIALRKVPGATILTRVTAEEEFHQYGLWSEKCAVIHGDAARTL